MQTIINIQGLSVCYGKKQVINNFCFEFKRGLFYAITGPNGSGKSTLLRHMLGFKNTDSTPILINEKPLNKYKQKELAKIQSYVAQQSKIDFDYTTKEVVETGRFPHQSFFNKRSNKKQELVNSAMTLVDILHLSNQSAKTLSGGELQRTMIARCLVQDTPIIILDEPVSQLDLYHQTQILSHLKELCKKQGRTIICVLHDFNQILNYADQVIMLQNGQLKTSGIPYKTLTPKNIKHIYNVDMNWAYSHDRDSIGLLQTTDNYDMNITKSQPQLNTIHSIN